MKYFKTYEQLNENVSEGKKMEKYVPLTQEDKNVIFVFLYTNDNFSHITIYKDIDQLVKKLPDGTLELNKSINYSWFPGNGGPNTMRSKNIDFVLRIHPDLTMTARIPSSVKPSQNMRDEVNSVTYSWSEALQNGMKHFNQKTPLVHKETERFIESTASIKKIGGKDVVIQKNDILKIDTNRYGVLTKASFRIERMWVSDSDIYRPGIECVRWLLYPLEIEKFLGKDLAERLMCAKGDQNFFSFISNGHVEIETSPVDKFPKEIILAVKNAWENVKPNDKNYWHTFTPEFKRIMKDAYEKSLDLHRGLIGASKYGL